MPKIKDLPQLTGLDGTEEVLLEKGSQTGRAPLGDYIMALPRVRDASFAVPTFADREAIPLATRHYGLTVYVVEAKRSFRWTKNGHTNGVTDDWIVLRTEDELLHLGNSAGNLSQDRITGLPQAIDSLDTQISSLRTTVGQIDTLSILSLTASKGDGPAHIQWAASGTPEYCTVHGDGWRMEVAGTTRSLLLPHDWQGADAPLHLEVGSNIYVTVHRNGIEATAQTQIVGVEAQGDNPFFATIAEAVSHMAQGTYFTCLDTDGFTPFANIKRTYKAIAQAPYYEDQGDEAAPVTRDDIQAIGLFKFLHSAPHYDVTADLQSMIANAKEGSVINPYGDGIVTGLTLTGKHGLTLAPKGQLTLTGDMDVSASNYFEIKGGFCGNRQARAIVTDIDISTQILTVDDGSDIVVGADIIIVGQHPFPWFKMRASVTSAISGNSFHYALITTIGGSDALVETGDEIRIMLTSDKSVRGSITINDSDYVVVDGYFERDIILRNVRHSKLHYRGRYGQPSLEFCSDIDVHIDTQDSLFYGFGSFKTRRITGKIKSLRANFGNAVLKNCYDSHFDSIFGEEGLAYGVQLRDDAGVDDPSTVNPDLQTTRLDAKGVSVGAIKLRRCGRGLFLDGITRKFSAPVVEIAQTVGQGASLMLTTAGAFDIDLPRVLIEDHGQMLDQIGYFRSNADIRLQQGTGVNIKGIIKNSKHSGYVFTNNASAGLCDRVTIDLELENCLSGIDVSGDGKDYEVRARGRNPAAHGTISLVNITGPGDNICVKAAITEAPTNGNKWHNVVKIWSSTTAGFTGSAHIEGVDARPGSVLNADIYVEPGNGALGNKGEVHVRRNRLLGGGLYGITARHIDKVFVYDNENSGHATADYHTQDFTPSHYRIEGQERHYSVSYAWPALPKGASARSTVQNVPQWTADSVITGLQYQGNSKGLRFTGYHANAGQIYLSAENPAANVEGDVSALTGQIRLSYKTIYRPY